MGNPLSVLIADVHPVYNKLDGTRILDKGAVGGLNLSNRVQCEA